MNHYFLCFRICTYKTLCQTLSIACYLPISVYQWSYLLIFICNTFEINFSKISFSELILTERSHIRTLALLDRVFRAPLQNNAILPPEQFQLLFPSSLRRLQEWHGLLGQRLKLWRKQVGPKSTGIGDLLIGMVREAHDYKIYYLLVWKYKFCKGKNLIKYKS